MKESLAITPDVRIASTLATKIQLHSVSYLECRGRMLSTDDPRKLQYDLPPVNGVWSVHDRRLAVVLPFVLSVKNAAAEGSPVSDLAEISVMIGLNYLLHDATILPNEDELPHFAGISGYMHAWPYFRADVQWLSTKLGFPALTLPIVLSGEVPSRILMSKAIVVTAATPKKAARKKRLSA